METAENGPSGKYFYRFLLCGTNFASFARPWLVGRTIFYYNPYICSDTVSGERTMQANEAFTGMGVVGAGPACSSACALTTARREIS